tara:strand:- start:509 stop:1132 length:624 start_codon:yes stop_codon:yes gene_type:complete
MDKNRVTGVEGFDIPNQTECELLEDSEIYYFNYKSYPEQIFGKNVLCYECDEDIEGENGETPDIGEECPSCGELISEYSELDMESFFDFDEYEGIENAPAGCLFNYFAIKRLFNDGKSGTVTATATICIQGIINIGKSSIQRVEYHDDGGQSAQVVAKLCPEEEHSWFEDWQNEGQTIADSLDIISLLEEKWSVRWETEGIFGVKGQ